MDDDRVRLIREPIDVPALMASLQRPEAGALTSFLGTVRAERSASGRALAALDYQAYEDMALEQMRGLRERALKQFDVLDVAVAHRLGRIPLGEASVAVVVSAAHRAAAFDAGRWIIDTLKVDVPIWKRDVWDDGSTNWSNAAEAADQPE
ncbi:MAG: molybdenum cofactor biosynthesis protein MoaE [Phycisphaerae bacterium]